jgi:two-component system LytT family response regulator
LEAEGINTQFFLKEESRKIISSRNIGTYIPQLEPYVEFMKTHRSHLINLKEVKRYLRGDKSVIMTDRTEIPVSEQYREELLTRLRKL